MNIICNSGITYFVIKNVESGLPSYLCIIFRTFVCLEFN